MPFPLAHLAAVLPLQRWCPKYCDFAALIVGSLTPDLAACIDDWEYFSHTLLGTFVFCLPAGLLTLLIFRSVGAALVSTLPNPHRDVLLPLSAGSPGYGPRVVLSLLIGSWIHVAWDLLTHDHSWLVQRVPFLAARFAGMPVNHLVWWVSSAAGTGLVAFVYLSLWKARYPERAGSSSSSDRRAYALWALILLLPLLGAFPLAIHDVKEASFTASFVRPVAMYYMGCAYVTLCFAGLLMKSRSLRALV